MCIYSWSWQVEEAGRFEACLGSLNLTDFGVSCVEDCFSYDGVPTGNLESYLTVPAHSSKALLQSVYDDSVCVCLCTRCFFMWPSGNPEGEWFDNLWKRSCDVKNIFKYLFIIFVLIQKNKNRNIFPLLWDEWMASSFIVIMASSFIVIMASSFIVIMAFALLSDGNGNQLYCIIITWHITGHSQWWCGWFLILRSTMHHLIFLEG
jgi:hypothetical protein